MRDGKGALKKNTSLNPEPRKNAFWLKVEFDEDFEDEALHFRVLRGLGFRV